MFTIKLRVNLNKDIRHEVDHAMWLYNNHYNNVLTKCSKTLNFWMSTKEYRSLGSLTEKYKFLKEKGIDKYKINHFFKMQEILYKSTLINSHGLLHFRDLLFAQLEKKIKDEKVKFKKKKNDILPFAYCNGRITGIKLNNDCSFSFRDGKNVGKKIYYELKTPYEIYPFENKNKLKMITFKREYIRGRKLYFLIFTFEGVPYNKGRKMGVGNCGIDPSLKSMYAAFDGTDEQIQYNLMEGVHQDEKKIAKLQRKLDRQRRALNPEAFKEDGQLSKHFYDTKKEMGYYPWKNSKNFFKTLTQIRNLSHIAATQRKIRANIIANDIISKANHIVVEHNNFAAMAKRSKKTTKNKKGRYNSKKRFGKSILGGAPSSFVQILENKVKTWKNGKFIRISEQCACTQYDHTNQSFNDEPSKDLSMRKVELSNGDVVHRDFHAAVNIMYCTKNKPEWKDGKKQNKVEKNANHFETDKIEAYYNKNRAALVLSVA